MSDHIPSTSNNTSRIPPTSPIHHAGKNRRKYQQTKLPTPPPDPRGDSHGNCSEKEFLEYLEQLQKHTTNYSRSTSHLASALIAENAFDHLDRLYKLMEQMLELRAQNAKLHRKIQDLEHINNLEKMYKQVDNLPEDDLCPELEKDTAFAETILESILSDPKQVLKPKGSLRRSIMRKHRNRSCSTTDKPVGLDTPEVAGQQRRASLCIANVKKSSKVSKWTRVKAAFKWEKASSTVGETKSLDGGVSEFARYLRVPSTNDDGGHSPSDSGAAEISTPGTLSSASSNENFQKLGRRSPYDDLRSSDDEHSHIYSSHSKEDPNISPRSSQRSHRTPWARMKDMINTKNPVRKKSRMSTHSDDIQIDIEFCSDNEDVFEDNNKTETFPNSSATSSARLDELSENDLPLVVRERYKSNDERLLEMDEADCKKVSKWTKVKRAFLPSIEGNSDSGLKEESENCSRDPIQSEINRNYRCLQKKLSIEFQEKLIEWKKIKQNATPAVATAQSGNVSDEPLQSSPAFMKKMEEWEKMKSQPAKSKSNIQMTSEENLPPEFKKKLQEWEKIKKSSVRKSTKKLGDVPRWKSVQNQKTSETPHVEIPVISEEFRKKLEEWKQIKAAGYKSDESDKKILGNMTPSPTFNRMNSQVAKTPQNKELQWYEKELNKIEKEKNRLERERQKFMEKEEKLSKLRKSVTGGHKKDILVHTPSGFYKFEGISRKFTQKLYEWEKSRGIGPESSTFAYLSPEYPKTDIPKVKINGEDHTPPLTRSRSVDSIIVSAVNIGCPLISQPSSLSLNDMEALETKCLVDSKSSSTDYIPGQGHDIDGYEPEALIVEVEDLEEETASPLKNSFEQHNPVYQCEEMRALCVCLTPKVRRSESARAQSNYSLIEEILTNLRNISENEVEIRKIQIRQEVDGVIGIKELCEQQKYLVMGLTVKLQRLQDENSSVISNISRENEHENLNHINDILDVVQDLSTELIMMAERLDSKIDRRINEKANKYFFEELQAQEIIEEIKCKLLELRRHLSYVCAASDSTAPRRRKLCRMKSILCEKSSNESQSTSITQSSENSGIGPTSLKSEIKNTQNQGAIRKRLRYRVETIRQKSLQDSEEEDERVTDQKKFPKLMRSRTISEGSTKSLERIEGTEEKNTSIFPAVTKSTFPDSPTRVTSTDSPVTIFVKTTRKLFTPLVERSLQDSENDAQKFNSSKEATDESEEKTLVQERTDDDIPSKADLNAQGPSVTGLPPLPSSPITQKKYLKDMSPSIRLMLNKYQQKISEMESMNKSGGSSGSASPVAWRSPTAERRVKAQTEKYQEEIIKLSPLTAKRHLHKSVSQGNIQNVDEQKAETIVSAFSGNQVCRQKSILKSVSATNLIQKKLSCSPFSQHRKVSEGFETSPSDQEFSYQLSDVRELSASRISSQLRLQKIRRAKEEFLNSGPFPATALDIQSEEVLEYPKKNRLSTISVESSSSAGSISPGILVKSISAGMINIVADAYKHFEGKPREYVSLPRNTRPDSAKKSPLSNLASKFRKVKMRKGKEKDRGHYSAVSELCRQSLVVDINESPQDQNVFPTNSANMNTTQENQHIPISKSSSWIRKSMFFKK